MCITEKYGGSDLSGLIGGMFKWTSLRVASHTPSLLLHLLYTLHLMYNIQHIYIIYICAIISLIHGLIIITSPLYTIVYGTVIYMCYCITHTPLHNFYVSFIQYNKKHNTHAIVHIDALLYF